MRDWRLKQDEKKNIYFFEFLSCKMVKYVSMPVLNFYSFHTQHETKMWEVEMRKKGEKFTNKLKKKNIF